MQDIIHPHLIDVVREAVRTELAAASHAPSSQAMPTTSDAAQRLGCSPKTVRKLFAEGPLPSHRFGGQHRISPEPSKTCSPSSGLSTAG